MNLETQWSFGYMHDETVVNVFVNIFQKHSYFRIYSMLYSYIACREPKIVRFISNSTSFNWTLIIGPICFNMNQNRATRFKVQIDSNILRLFRRNTSQNIEETIFSVARKNKPQWSDVKYKLRKLRIEFVNEIILHYSYILTSRLSLWCWDRSGPVTWHHFETHIAHFLLLKFEGMIKATRITKLLMKQYQIFN